MRLKCRCDCKYVVNVIFQCQLDIPQQLVIIYIILINKCITIAYYSNSLSWQMHKFLCFEFEDLGFLVDSTTNISWASSES